MLKYILVIFLVALMIAATIFLADYQKSLVPERPTILVTLVPEPTRTLYTSGTTVQETRINYTDNPHIPNWDITGQPVRALDWKGE